MQEHQNNSYTIFRYNFKYYPLHKLLNHPRSGIYIGISPNVFYQDKEGTGNRFGVGLTSLVGVQYVINDRFTICADYNVNMTSHPNTDSDFGVYYAPMFYSIQSGYKYFG